MCVSDRGPEMLNKALELLLSLPSLPQLQQEIARAQQVFNHDTLVLTAGGSLAWEPNLLALCQLWGIFPVFGIPRWGGTTAVWSTVQISAPGAVHSGRCFWQG